MHDRATVEQVRLLLDEGLSIAEVARRSGVSRSAIRWWRANGFVGRRERHDHGPQSPCPLVEKAPADAYAYLLGQYLGDGDIAEMANGVFRLQIHACDDYPGIRAECVEAMHAVIPGNRVGLYPAVGCTRVSMYSRHWPCLFPQHGPGPKHLRPIELEHWQEAAALARHPELLIRGLIHSDGCRAINRVTTRDRTYEYPRYFFSNTSADIQMIFGRCCDELGVEWRQNNHNSISVARRESVAILEDLVGPKY